MRTQSADPGARDSRTADSTALDAGSGERGERNLPHLGLSAHVLEALRAEGIHTLDDWKRLGRRRLAIFGVVPSVARMLDKAAEALT